MRLLNDLDVPVTLDCFGCDVDGRTLHAGESVVASTVERGFIFDNVRGARCLSFATAMTRRRPADEAAWQRNLVRVSQARACAP